ncbi:MAG: glycosyltransferase family 2 protein [Deltaproteobacteria bacterium]|nr:glycosyltransferase family 2 protein [Deltaproteobacteria bacterium]MBW1953504.1 glycosyltransferase family 2 protein [Deltaproteobacteria bacterium]MBW1987210.1 glycosyltransferase family 2 protein [Deltaproteobacteria bacterium]MBW2134310.1 glycosyltransferase family 2 protein [Deltaproteobacteria bacterium]
MARLTVTIITLNEEANIVACLESVRWAEEIVVVDSQSSDRTVELARAFTDRIFVVPWQGFAWNKNLALDQARMEWVFSLDADERVTPALREEIQEHVRADGPLEGYRVARKNFFCGQWIKHLGWYPDYTIRLFRRGQGHFVDREVHEGVAVDGRVGTLQHPLEHYTYDNLSDFVQRMDRYSLLAARELVKQGKRPCWGELLWRPWLTFVNLYFLKKGFLEGRAGYTLAVLYSVYNFLKYAKLRELRQQAQTNEVSA